MAVGNLLQVHRLFANGLNYLKDRQSAGRLSKSVLFPRGAKDLNKLATSPYPGDSVQEVGHPRHCRADARNRAPYAAGAGVGRWWGSDDRLIFEHFACHPLPFSDSSSVCFLVRWWRPLCFSLIAQNPKPQTLNTFWVVLQIRAHSRFQYIVRNPYVKGPYKGP